MHYLALDVGTKRTGVAFGSSDDDILFSLETIAHSGPQQLLDAVLPLIEKRHIDEVVVGLPLLPSGEEGSQAAIARTLYDLLLEKGITAHLLDERYTTTQTRGVDSDAAAACEILSVWLQKNT